MELGYPLFGLTFVYSYSNYILFSDEVEPFDGLLTIFSNQNSNNLCFNLITPVQDNIVEDRSIIGLSLQSNDVAVDQNLLGTAMLIINNDDRKFKNI